MKNNFVIIIISVLTALFLGSSCAHNSINFNTFMGTNIKDLENACSAGKEKTISLPYPDTFDKMLKILKENSLTVYQSNFDHGYIIAMGFKKQVNTTRVGIFLKSIPPDKTKITLSSLSSTALKKAEEIIFDNLDK